MVATAWDLVILSLLSLVQVQIEKRYARSALRSTPPAKAKRRELRPEILAETPAERASVEIRGLSKSFGLQRVLSDVSLHLAPGSVTVLPGRANRHSCG